jgi:hypothetical protein
MGMMSALCLYYGGTSLSYLVLKKIDKYPNGLSEKHSDHVLHPARQREFFNLSTVVDDAMDLQPA